jgi:DNA-binding NarL/FixJ family response regulator
MRKIIGRFRVFVRPAIEKPDPLFRTMRYSFERPRTGDAVRRIALQIDDPEMLDRVATSLAAEPSTVLMAAGRGADVVISDHLPSRADPPTIVLAADPNPSDFLKPAVAAVLPRDCTGPDLRLAVEAVMRGFAILPRPSLGIGSDDPDGVSRGTAEDLLTAREREVLRLLAEGASNKIIARRLGISFHTAKFHVASIAAKLDATGRTDAVAQAVRLGLIML